jgi:peptidyl-prolyl cis-trans isomerase D
MLKVFRDNLKYLSWILWGVIIIFIAFVFVDFGGGLDSTGAEKGPAARVGDEQITVAEFQRQYRQLEARMRAAWGEQFTPEVARQIRLPMQALDGLVAQRILAGEARRLGLETTDEELRRAILELPVFTDESGGFVGDEEYSAILRANGHTPASFERDLRTELLLQKLNTVLAPTVSVSEARLEEAYRERHESARIRYVQLPPGRYAADSGVTPEEVRGHFAANTERYRLPERRLVEYLLVDLGKLQGTSQAGEASPEELRAYYDAHRDEFAQEERVHARHILLRVDDQRPIEAAEAAMAAIRGRLDAGEDFAAVAGEVSEDPGSKPRGGDLGFFGRGRMLKEFEDAAFAASPGQLVGPVRTSFGLHLIQVLERRAAGQPEFDEVRGLIQNRLRAERARAAAEAKAKELAARLRSGGAPGLAAVAQEESATTSLETPPAFAREDLVPGIGRATPFAAAAFELAPGGFSEPVQVPRGWAILGLKEVQPPRLPELAEVEVRVRADLERERQVERATAALARAKAEIEAGKPFDQAAQELGVEARESEDFGRQDPVRGLGAVPGLAAAALALDEGAIGGPLAAPQGPVLFQVVARQRFSPLDFARDREELRRELEGDEIGRLLQAIVEKRRQELNVTYDRVLLEQFGIMEEGQAG